MSDTPGPIWDDVVGQDIAISQLRAAADSGPVHAYLFVGPAGSTKLQAARAFAARVISGGEDVGFVHTLCLSFCSILGSEPLYPRHSSTAWSFR